MNYAGVWKRLAAYIIDIIPILGIVFFIFYFFFGFDEVIEAYLANRKDFESRKDFLYNRNYVRDITFLIWIIYSTMMDCSGLQGTYGKYLLGIKVVDLQGNQITATQSMKRYFVKVGGAIPLFLGYIWAAFRHDKAAWHDLFAKSRVVIR